MKNDKMNWKNLPYWLKGGIIGLTIGLLYGLFSIILIVLVILGYLPASPFNLGTQSPKFLFLIIPFIGTLIQTSILFVIGSLIGYIYGKVKLRKEALK